MMVNSGTHIVEKRSGMVNSDSGTEEQLWWNSGTEMVDQRNRDDRPEEHRWWNSGTMMVEQRNSDGGTVEQIW